MDAISITRKVGRRKTGKMTVSVRISPQTKARLDQAVEQLELDSFSDYVETALKTQFRRDGIK
jgi:hypothetical protein